MQKTKLTYSAPECRELKLEPRNLVCQSLDIFTLSALGDYNDITDTITIVWD